MKSFFLYFRKYNQTNKVIEEKRMNFCRIEGFVCECVWYFFFSLNIFSRVVFIDINKQSTVISIQQPFAVDLPKYWSMLWFSTLPKSRSHSLSLDVVYRWDRRYKRHMCSYFYLTCAFFFCLKFRIHLPLGDYQPTKRIETWKKKRTKHILRKRKNSCNKIDTIKQTGQFRHMHHMHA